MQQTQSGSAAFPSFTPQTVDDDDMMLPFASLSSSPPHAPPEPSFSSSSVATLKGSNTTSSASLRANLPPLSERAQDRLNQRRLALFKQPRQSEVAGSSRGTYRQGQPHHHHSSSNPASSSSTSFLSSSPTRTLRTPGTAGNTAVTPPPLATATTGEEGALESCSLADLAASPSQVRLRAKIREQCDALRRQMRAERVERGRRAAGVGPGGGGENVLGRRKKDMLSQLKGAGMMLDEKEGDEEDEEAAWEREDEELIRRTMLLEHRRYMMQAGLSSHPDADWHLDPDDAVALEEEIMREDGRGGGVSGPAEMDTGPTMMLDPDEEERWWAAAEAIVAEEHARAAALWEAEKQQRLQGGGGGGGDVEMGM
ncbi:hypothetical protein OC835_006966 [Tilletia horrida]|nr:hypothetical protein OC835_006966 [Tilletia horrida]